MNPLVHTPTHSFSEPPGTDAQAGGAGGSGSLAVASPPLATPNSAEHEPVSGGLAEAAKPQEQEAMWKKLLDQSFDILEYPDPLMPREPSWEDARRNAMTQEQESHLQGVLVRAKEKAIIAEAIAAAAPAEGEKRVGLGLF